MYDSNSLRLTLSFVVISQTLPNSRLQVRGSSRLDYAWVDQDDQKDPWYYACQKVRLIPLSLVKMNEAYGSLDLNLTSTSIIHLFLFFLVPYLCPLPCAHPYAPLAVSCSIPRMPPLS